MQRELAVSTSMSIKYCLSALPVRRSSLTDARGLVHALRTSLGEERGASFAGFLRRWGQSVKTSSTKWQLTFTRFVPWGARDYVSGPLFF